MVSYHVPQAPSRPRLDNMKFSHSFFNDLPTGLTPTTNRQPLDDFKDYTNLNNIQTPTPMDASINTFFLEAHSEMLASMPLRTDDQPCSSPSIVPPPSTAHHRNSHNNAVFSKTLNMRSHTAVGTTPTAPASNDSYDVAALNEDLFPCDLFKPTSYDNQPTSDIPFMEIASRPGSDAGSAFAAYQSHGAYDTPSSYSESDRQSPYYDVKSATSSPSNYRLVTLGGNSSSSSSSSGGATAAPGMAASCHQLSEVTGERRGGSGRARQARNGHTFVGEKPHTCDFAGCPKRFARIDELRRHKRTHADVKPYSCEHCSKTFTRSDHLTTHVRTHTGEKPYACERCDKRFARSDERLRHRKTHDNPRRVGRRPKRQRPKASPSDALLSLTNAHVPHLQQHAQQLPAPPLHQTLLSPRLNPSSFGQSYQLARFTDSSQSSSLPSSLHEEDDHPCL